MKFRNIAWMGAGLLLAGVAGAAVVCRRKGERELPDQPGETKEHAALRVIMEESAAYNDALYERISELEKAAPAARGEVLARLTAQNQNGRKKIDTMRASLQQQLGEQGRTFNDVDGFAELISEYRGITLKQQKRHLAVFQRVRKLENVPPSPELHAYLKLGFKEDDQRRADTDLQLMKAAAGQRELMLRAGRVLSSILDTETAQASTDELNELGEKYQEFTETIHLYQDDDPQGAVSGVAELRSLYSALLPMLREHAARLRDAGFYDNEALREVVERMLPPAR